MKEESYSHNMILKGKVISLIESIKYNKGIVVTGPRCSGKTSIIKGLGYLLKNSDINIEMRISVLNPDIYNLEKLYGTAESGVMNPEISTNRDVKISSITSNVLEIATKGFDLLSKMNNSDDEEEKSEADLEVEKHIDVSSDDSGSENSPDGPKLLKTLLFESSSINPLWSDCLVEYMKESNYTTNIFSSCTENDLERHELHNTIPLTFPNGASTRLSRDILMMFECDNLREASPAFVANTMLVYTEENTLKWKELFSREKAKLMKQLKKNSFIDFRLNEHFEVALKDFVLPFIGKL